MKFLSPEYSHCQSMDGGSLEVPMWMKYNTSVEEKTCIKFFTGCCRIKLKALPCHRLSILLFIFVFVSAWRCTVANATMRELHKPLLDVQEILSRIKKNAGAKESCSSHKHDLSNENVAHGFHDQEIAVPVKIHHETGRPIEHGRHFLRKRSSITTDTTDRQTSSRLRRSAKRSTEDDFESLSTDLNKKAVANFSIDAFGEKFLMQLSSYSKFIAPTFTLHFKGNVSQTFNDATEDVPRHCFYTGIVNSRPDHTAVFSLCGGMFGAWRTNDVDYLIEPHETNTFTEDAGNVDDSETGTKPHRVYRRKTKREAEKPQELCAFTESIGDGETSGEAKDATRNSRRSRPREHEKKFKEKDRKKGSLSREKRYVSYPRHVEVMVTTDYGMMRTHGANLQHYVLTLMAIVHQVYLDPSIGNQINIVFVKLVVIDGDSVHHGPRITKNAHECLRNFCQWQADENDPDDSHPNHHDTAVLITRQDICRTDHACDTLGLAELGTMCDPLRSCSINEDNGLSTAFTIAHELGHEFNAPHDNNEKCLTAAGKPGGMHVMSPTLDHKSKPWSWSSCSATYITNYLDYGNGQCLLDEPPLRKLPLPAEEPGQIYNVNQQCSFVYGKGVTHCGFMTTCARLWCVSADRRHGCRTPHMPWADGTKCGPGKWCQRGQCVPEDRDRRPVDGSWGQWSKFGDCSLPCGGGVRIAYRFCDNPAPRNGGRYCIGKRKKFRSCNAEECPEPRNFRAEQCRSYDWSRNRHVIKGVPENAVWIPKYDGILLQDRCKLICQLKREDQYASPWYVLRPKVTNGTPCGPDTHDICVEGICKRAGCDHVLNSNTKEDDCGICGGDNSGCRAVKGVYNRGKISGYSIVVEIPAGATNIVVEQRSYGYNPEDNNYLALRDASGRFILNGNRNVVQFEHSIEKPSASGFGYTYQFDYTGTDNLVERINSTRAIQENVTVLILAAGDLLPPNIKYRYHIPLPEQISYSWDPYGPWNDCSQMCQGHTRRKVLCVRSGDGQIVADHKCHASHKPPFIGRSCNTHCEIKWRIKSQECSTRCGRGRLFYQHECIKLILAPGQDSSVDVLDDKECTTAKPDKYSVCYGECLPTSWRYGEWSQCDRTCGGGAQRRTAVCRDSNGIEHPSSECDARARITSRMCNVFGCPQWVTGDFTQCLATCGTGIRRRRVWCRGPSGGLQSDSICNPVRKPPSTVKCHLAPCPKWKYENWGKCSVTCGSGVTVRLMRCTDYLGRHVDDNQCDEGLREKDIKPCILADCIRPALLPVSVDQQPFLVNRSSFDSSPDDSFDEGILTKSVILEGKRNLENTPQDDVSEREESVVSTGHAQWRTGHWTDCTVTCGGGHRERYVSCRDNTDREINDDQCRPDQVPDRRQECNMTPCYGEWRMGAWSDCSASCGTGVKSRYVGCIYHGRYERQDKCDTTIKPPTEAQCQVPTICSNAEPFTDEIGNAIVPEVTELENDILLTTTDAPSTGIWRTGPWSECSSSCGSGNRKRAVVCHGNCENLSVPDSVELCDAGPCPSWRSNEWSECSVSCGRGISTRSVQCVMADNSGTSDSRCNIMKRPSNTIPCGRTRCPEWRYRWRTKPWSGCSATCGRGMKTRQITCIDSERSVVPDEMCASLRIRKPKTARRCRTQRRCPKWHTGRWNLCSTSCGIGVRVRGVSCRYKRKTIFDEMCDQSKKPEDLERCEGTECETYTWKTFEWSSCSVSCGVGVMRRRIACVNGYNSVAPENNCPSRRKPTSEQPCRQEPCSTYWHVEAWSECSVTCGDGTETRIVRCVYADKHTQRLLPASSCDLSTKPDTIRQCNDNSCEADVRWRVGPWSSCSVTCGKGISQRQVLCFSLTTGTEVRSSACEDASGSPPVRLTPCNRAPCIPTSCRHAQLHQNARSDGEYFLLIRGRPVQIYCKGMNTRYPYEYITLRAGKEENFSEIYRLSLNNSETCPHNGSRNDNCACTANPQSGKTTFQRIRFDMRSMKVIINDFAFAEFEYGRPVAYGVAGDCYSKARCPQGRFRVNLNGTGFTVAHTTQWSSYGRSAVQKVTFSEDRLTANGQCGGYCGQCRPDPIRGLRLTLTAPDR